MAKKTEIPNEEFIIADVETLKVLAHPQRLEILRSLERPHTVKQVAEKIDADPTKLYYHIRMMEKTGVIYVTETNVVSGIIEKTYQVVAKTFTVAEGLVSAETPLSEDEMDSMVSAILDHTRVNARKSIRAGLLKPDDSDGISTTLWSYAARLTPDQVNQLDEQMKAILKNVEGWGKANKDDDDARPYAFTHLFFPLVEDDDE